MKTDVFSSAINTRQKVRFIYGAQEVILEPYYITTNRFGKKVVFGKINYSNQIRSFEYDKIANLKVMKFSYFSPIIPIIPVWN